MLRTDALSKSKGKGAGRELTYEDGHRGNWLMHQWVLAKAGDTASEEWKAGRMADLMAWIARRYSPACSIASASRIAHESTNSVSGALTAIIAL